MTLFQNTLTCKLKIFIYLFSFISIIACETYRLDDRTIHSEEQLIERYEVKGRYKITTKCYLELTQNEDDVNVSVSHALYSNIPDGFIQKAPTN